MHEKYAKVGLAVVSLNIDDPQETGVEEKAHDILGKKHATFTNLALAKGEDSGDWFDNKLNLTDGLPSAAVYDRQGKLVEQYNGKVDYAKIEPVLVKQLK